MINDRQVDMLTTVIADEIVHRFLVSEPVPSGNEYQTACDRFEIASNAHGLLIRLANKLVDIANHEYDAAQINLRSTESQPGIAKPEYRLKPANEMETPNPLHATEMHSAPPRQPGDYLA